ncbi:NAD(P)/FAD-dependent oxidoreductase [Nocardioides rotundus]|uniref:flavin-containing monooxygenase n=1 Tax=Nocardioides rotundus TaxID=1774216 RepID=UPI001CC1BFA0|nr:NAD(P)/FAD-dependent oxidoreductase [Nocardioides rotundus]UAL30105.1 NAD(P)/FAD-dependent oxidoreductase [Nocardioides rotundus]
MSEHVDVLIIGAGLSGIGAAAQLSREHPGRSYLVLESRAASGGTWDLFRYPGVRSDSDMYTLGYRFKPWTGEKSLADGGAILDYVRETAREYAVDQRILFEHRVVRAEWDSDTARWTVTAETPDGTRELTADFLWACSGYYDYEQGFTPTFADQESFAGEVIHPQHWPEGFDPTGKRVVVIGSGATAVTLVPALAKGGAEQVTMLQRSPTYILSLPAVDKIASWLRRRLPEKAAYRVVRWKNIGAATALYQFCQAQPRLARRLIRGENLKRLPASVDVDTHFKPRYDPWDQRLCLVPDSDLFKELRSGRAEVVTDTIERFTPAGLRLGSGRELEADVVVTATGLNLKAFGGAEFVVDGDKVDLSDSISYRALMLSGLPNFAFTIGYTNASWTLKADLVAEYVCRLLAHMDAHGYRAVVPVPPEGLGREPFMDFSAGYVLRSIDDLPRQGDKEPWRLRQNYLHDVRTIRRSRIDDAALAFS